MARRSSSQGAAGPLKRDAERDSVRRDGCVTARLEAGKPVSTESKSNRLRGLRRLARCRGERRNHTSRRPSSSMRRISGCVEPCMAGRRTFAWRPMQRPSSRRPGAGREAGRQSDEGRPGCPADHGQRPEYKSGRARRGAVNAFECGFAAGSRREIRFFAGLSIEQTAEVLENSGETVMRDWKVAGRGCSGSSIRLHPPHERRIPSHSARVQGSVAGAAFFSNPAHPHVTAAPLVNASRAPRSGARARSGISGSADPRCCGRTGRTTCLSPTESAARARRWRRARGSGQHSLTRSSSQSGRGHSAAASGGADRTSANTTAACRISSRVPRVMRAW